MGESLLKRLDDPRTIHGTGRAAPNQEPTPKTSFLPARADVRPLTRVIEVRTVTHNASSTKVVGASLLIETGERYA